MKRIGNFLGRAYALIALILVYVPTIVMIVYSFNEQSSNKKWTGFTVEWYSKLWTDSGLWKTFGLSVSISLMVTLLVTVIGTLGAMGLARYKFFGKNILTNAIYVPMIVPGVVFAVAIMGLISLLGLEKGIYSVVLGNVILMLPYMVLTVRTRFLGFDRSIEEAAMDLGSNGVETFFRITLPNVLPGVFSGAVLTFALTLDDIIMADFLAGPNCLTFPMKVYNSVKKGVSPEINALETIIVLFIGAFVLLYFLIGSFKQKMENK